MYAQLKNPVLVGSLMIGATTTLFTAERLGVLNRFTAGEVASATAINENFDRIQQLLDGNLDGQNLKEQAIGKREIKAKSIDTSLIADGAVGTNQLGSGAVTSQQLSAGAVGATHLQANSVGAGHLQARSVGSSELAEAVSFGGAGYSGNVDWYDSSTNRKISLQITGEGGGGGWFYNKRNGNAGVYVGPVGGTGDGGLVSVYNSAGKAVVQLQPSGDIYKTGNNGFVHPHPRDPSQQIVYMSLEGGERGSYFRTSGRLTRGEAVIVPPEHWRLVTAAEGITVQATARGDCQGIYVAESRLDRIVVRECGGGRSDTEFDLLVMGLRAGFEKHRVFEANTMFLPKSQVPVDELDRGVEKAMVQNGILLPDGQVNHDLVERLRVRARASEGSVMAVEPVALEGK